MQRILNMTYNDAAGFRDKHVDLVGKQSGFLHHMIEYLLIAPDDIREEDIPKVYVEAVNINGNELALKNLGFYNGSMDVYVIWEAEKGRVEQMRLAAYLAAAGLK